MTPKTNKLIIYGDSSFAEMVAHYFQTDSEYTVVGYCVDAAYRTRETIDSLSVVELESIEDYFSPEEHSVFAAIGYKSVRTHKLLYEKISKLSYPVASFVSSRAIVDSCSNIGNNCLVLPGAIIEPYVVIGENCFINSGATVCHHTHIGDHSILAAGSLVGGHVNMGESSLIGFNATVAELLCLGEETLLGAGSLLLENTEEHSMYVGSPAKVIRKHIDTGIVLSSDK